MKSKQIMAMALAATMVAGSSLTAFASSAPTPVTTPSGSATGTATGSISTVDKNQVKVVLPTSAILTFSLDPQGLLGMTGDSATFDELQDSAGLIIGQSAVGIINKSTIPIKMSVELTAKDSATTSGIFVKTKEDAVGSAAASNARICLYALPGYKNAYKDGDDLAGNYVPGTTALALKDSVQTVDFVLDAADYVINRTGTAPAYTYSYDLATTADNGVGAALKLGGYVNPNFDWKDYSGSSATKHITVETVFKYDTTTATVDAMKPAHSYGFGWDKTNIAAVNAQLMQLASRCETEAATFSLTANDPNNKNVDMTYSLVGTDELSHVWFLNTDGVTWLDAMDPSFAEYVAHDTTAKKFTLKKEFLSYYKAGDTVKVWLQFNDGSEDAEDSPVDASAPACVITVE